jgi:hypothetical protein
MKQADEDGGSLFMLALVSPISMSILSGSQFHQVSVNTVSSEMADIPTFPAHGLPSPLVIVFPWGLHPLPLSAALVFCLLPSHP